MTQKNVMKKSAENLSIDFPIDICTIQYSLLHSVHYILTVIITSNIPLFYTVRMTTAVSVLAVCVHFTTVSVFII